MRMAEPAKKIIPIAVISLAVLAAYANSLPNPFIFDDYHVIVRNAYIKSFEHLGLFFKGLTTSEPLARGMYRPLLMITFAVNHFLNGLNPYGYHLVNIFIHFLNALMLFAILGVLFKDLAISRRLATVLLFAWHPLNTEAVTYISCRSDLLVSFFILSSFFCYLGYCRTASCRGYWLSVILYLSALLTKETGVVIVGLLAAYELIYEGGLRRRWQRLTLRFLPFAVVTLGYFLLRKVYIGGLLANPAVIPNRSYLANVLTQSAVSFYYLWLFMFPFGLSVDHSFPVITSLFWPLAVLSLASLTLIICLCLSRRPPPVIAFSGLWYFICLAPKFYARLNFVCAEHHSYPALFSLYFIAAFVLLRIRSNFRYLKEGALFIFGACFLLTVIRNFQWRDEYTLWKATLKVNPRSELARGSLGALLLRQGRFKEARQYITSTMSSKFKTLQGVSMANLAISYAFSGDPQKGLHLLNTYRERLLKVNPSMYFKALGTVYSKMGSPDKAREFWERALRLHPADAHLKAVLGNWYLDNTQDIDKARDYFRSSLKDDPDLAIGHFGLGRTLEKDNPAESIEEYEKTIKLAPRFFEAYYRIGNVYASKLLDKRAEYYFKKAIEINPGFAPVHYELALYYLSLPNPDHSRAAACLRKAKELKFKIPPEIENLIPPDRGK